MDFVTDDHGMCGWIRLIRGQDRRLVSRARCANPPVLCHSLSQAIPNVFQGPASPAEVRIIEADGRVVSLYVGTRRKLWVDGTVRRGIMVQDVLTHPEYRGRGFVNDMVAAFLAEMRDWATAATGASGKNEQAGTSAKSYVLPLIRDPYMIAPSLSAASILRLIVLCVRTRDTGQLGSAAHHRKSG